MKKLLLILTGSAFILVSSCSKEDSPYPETESMVGTSAKSARSLIYSPGAFMYGKSYTEWTTGLWKWALSFDCAHFPILDLTGALQDQGQSGQVFFLSGRRGGTISVTVPAGKSIFMPIMALSDNYPNTTGGRTPLPGQSPEVFLDSLARLYATEIGECSLVIDGLELTGLQNEYMVESTGPYTYSANGDLANCYYSGLTGSPQLFCQSGVYVMLKPFAPGVHTIVRTAQFRGVQFQYNYQITQL